MRSKVSGLELFGLFTIGSILLGLSFLLVHQQYRARSLFIQHEQAQDVARRLADDEADLLLKVRRASLPGSIAGGAEKMKLVPATDENTVELVVDKQRRVTIPPEYAPYTSETAPSEEQRDAR